MSALPLASCDKGDTLLLQVTADGEVDKFKLFIRDDKAHFFVYKTPEWTDATKMGTLQISTGQHGIGVRLDHPGEYSVFLFGLKGNVPCETGGTDMSVNAGDGGMPDFGSGTAYYWAMTGHLEGNEEVAAHLFQISHADGMNDDADCDLFPSSGTWPGRSGGPGTAIPATLLDCNDTRADFNPFATDRCGSGEDQNCDGIPAASSCPDSDGDGDPDETDCAPNDPRKHHPNDKDRYPELPNCCGYAFNAVDGRVMRMTSHTNEMSYAMAAECHTDRCGTEDLDCDGKPTACKVDEDCDTFAPPASAGKCEKTKGDGTLDCDDCNGKVYPGAKEICGDGIDNNCNGAIDEGCVPCDLDGDGFEREDGAGCPSVNNPPGKPIDCNDDDSGIFPAYETAPRSISVPVPLKALGKDNVCDPLHAAHSVACTLHGFCKLNKGKKGDVDCLAAYDLSNCPQPVMVNSKEVVCDADKDGFIDVAHKLDCDPMGRFTLYDCDDMNPSIYPGAPDLCGDGKAWNCEADIACSNDLDNDGYIDIWDCNNNDPAIHPNAVEICDGLDNDCDGLVDEGNPDSTKGTPMGTVAGGNSTLCNTSGIGICGGMPAKGPPPHCVCARLSVLDHYFTHAKEGDTKRLTCPDDASEDDKKPGSAPRCYFAVQPEKDTAETCDGKDTSCTRFDDFAPADHMSIEQTMSLDTRPQWQGVTYSLTDCKGTVSGGTICCKDPMPGCRDAQVDPLHCGNCNQQCSTQNGTPLCASGKCGIVCKPQFANCNGTVSFSSGMPGADGCETNTFTAANCGPGGAAPFADPKIQAGCGCACSTQNGAPACGSGSCTIACGAGFANCDNVVGNSCSGNQGNGCEVSVYTDVLNCGTGGNDGSAGGCGQQCSTQNGVPSCSQVGNSGKCSIACLAGFANCDNVVNTAKGAPGNNGCEVSVFTDVLNCGAGGNDGTAGGCGQQCATQNGTPSCSNQGGVGKCAIVCNSGFANCDNTVNTGKGMPGNNGCEVSVFTDALNCGAGGNDGTAAGCGQQCSKQNGTPSCSNQGGVGKCSIVCNAGFANCNNTVNTAKGAPGNDGCEISVFTDILNCGAGGNDNSAGGCGQQCSTQNGSPACSNVGGIGKCSITCNSGFANCDNTVNTAKGAPGNNGCEVSVFTDPLNCGGGGNDSTAQGCGQQCSTQNGVPACSNVGGAGKCSITCNAGFANCDNTVNTAKGAPGNNGCEVSVFTDPLNCGGGGNDGNAQGCGQQCSKQNGTPSCSNSGGVGKCAIVCNAGFANCNNTVNTAKGAPGNDGCEVSVFTDVLNCGAGGNDGTAAGCGQQCSTQNGTPSCSNSGGVGKCSITCNAGFANCDNTVNTAKNAPGNNGCEVSVFTDVLNCGAGGNDGTAGGCGQQCSTQNGVPACANSGGIGKCSITCAAGFANCNNIVNTAKGAPGNDGCETSVFTDVLNCGAGGNDGTAGGCGQQCSTQNGTPSCSNSGGTGKCSIVCKAGFANCDNTVNTAKGTPGNNGCEINTFTDVNNCGAGGNDSSAPGCGKVCSKQNGTPSCTNGVCGISCNPGFANCNGIVGNNGANSDGCETNIASGDPNNCGGCGMACGAKGDGCANSLCTCGGGAPCGAGQRCSNGMCVCDAMSCGSGCCAGNTCNAKSQFTCGNMGGACTDCTVGGAADTCDAMGSCRCGVNAPCGMGQHCVSGVCECDVTSCPSGCCTAVSNGTCLPGNTALNCGTGGNLCTSCSGNVNGSACLNQHCGCSTFADCPGVPMPRWCDAAGGNLCKQNGCDPNDVGKYCNGGCCNNNSCIDGRANNNNCGNGGAVCTNCNGMQTCTLGVCL